MIEEDLPVVVAGGGPAGCAAALALLRGGRRVLLLDDSPPGTAKPGEGLPPAARPLLRDLGVLDRFLADGHLSSYGNLSAWGGPDPQATDFIHDRNGHGWQLDRARFDASLRDAVRAVGGEVRESARLASAERAGDGWRLTVDGGTIECGWIADATGRRSAIARRHGAERVHADALVAFHARFRSTAGDAGSAGDRDSRTLIESVPDGWWYTALVPGAARVIVFLTDADLADRAALLSADGFAAALRETVHVRAALDRFGYAMEERPRGADAGSARLDRFVGDGWVAAGDAALSFDPLSSQGMLTALYTGMKAGQALAAHLAGDGAALAAYAARLEEIHAAYARNRTEFYGYEIRWPEREFWRRRTGRSGE